MFNFRSLEKTWLESKDPYDLEHVSPYMYRTNLFKIGEVKAEKNIFWPDLRITLDNQEDYTFLREIILNLHPKYGFNYDAKMVVDFIKSNPQLLKLIDKVKVNVNPFETRAEI